MPAVAGPSSSRTSTARQSSASTTLARRTDLPPYTPRTFPLTPSARTALSALSGTTSLDTLNTFLTKTLESLIENIGSVHENHHGNSERLSKARDRLERKTNVTPEERGRIDARTAAVGEMSKRLAELSKRMEESVRRTLDAQVFASDLLSTVTELSQNNNEDDPDPTTQGTFTPTDPRSGTQRPSPGFAELLSRKRDRYTSFTLAQRYSSDNSYRQFRSMQHEMQFPDRPMPHESTWFSTRAAAPGETMLNEDEDDEEGDLAIARETVSTKCPITLREFVEPVTSRKCPHSFEREAILGMIASSSVRCDAQGNVIESSTQRRSQRDAGQKGVRCPVPGCEKVLVQEDLLADAVLVRKIARLQRAARMAEEEEEDDEEDGGGHRRKRRDGRSVVSLRSSDNEAEDISDEDEEVTGTVRRRIIKGERRSTAPLQL